MAGKRCLLIPLVVLACAPAFGQEPDNAPRAERGERPGPELENVRRAIEALTPEQRKRFEANFARWASLSPEEKKALRGSEEMRRNIMRDELQAAMKELGLPLQGELREQFRKRYAEERRKIEEGLRKEIVEKRQPLLRELIARLKTEFASPAPVPPAAPTTPAAAP